MIKYIFRKVFGSVNDRTIKQFEKMVKKINDLEDTYVKLSDENLKEQTNILKARLKAGESLNDILPNAFAIVREAAKRVLGQRAFDVQLVGGIVLHEGMIAEMKTGEGKTLTAVLACYLNALTEKGVHVVTVNDYLAKRDSEWMGAIHKFLGLSVGCIIHGLDDEERKEAYNCDITYGTNNEYGFDYLRDNMKYSINDMCQRGHHFAIVDEVDSILIDEARTPLIISGPTEDNSKLYYEIDRIIPKLKKSDYKIEEKEKSVFLTEEGTENAEKILKTSGMIKESANLYDIEYVELVHHVNQALKAHKLFKNEVDYIVKNNQVIIIDEFTGRMQEGRRFSDGLHQALEAKEGVVVQNENQTLASVTFQNYFRMYEKLSGMTGTAMTEAVEFESIYNLKSVEIPTNLPLIRNDENDEIYKTGVEKYKAIVKTIKDCYKRKQPVLVGTITIEKSEDLSKFLEKEKIPHQILNAKHHEREAKIVAQAGIPGTITIATNMAGRGTDIMLGGNPDMMIQEMREKVKDEKGRIKKEKEIYGKVKKDKEIVLKAGGLFILGTERHESRRIDNQLRGRSGRQGDPGRSKFFLSLEDDLMRIFGSEKLSAVLSKLGLKDDEAIFHPWINKAIQKAQHKVEQMNYEIRKNLLKYDDVMNEQRKMVFEQRKDIISATDISPEIEYLREEINRGIITTHIPEKSYIDQWDLEGLDNEVTRIYSLELGLKEFASKEGISEAEILNKIAEETTKHFKSKDELYGEEVMRDVEKRIFLMTLDHGWKDHLFTLDKLKKGINLRAYSQKDPLIEYKREAFSLFEAFLNRINIGVIRRLAHIQIRLNSEGESNLNKFPKQQKMKENREELANALNSRISQKRGGDLTKSKGKTIKNSRISSQKRDPANPESWGKVGRNEACPCGSGKKYKQCHGKI
ncbi:preprotein translocase subunit SecA [Pseudomonadota bacterium]